MFRKHFEKNICQEGGTSAVVSNLALRVARRFTKVNKSFGECYTCFAARHKVSPALLASRGIHHASTLPWFEVVRSTEANSWEEQGHHGTCLLNHRKGVGLQPQGVRRVPGSIRIQKWRALFQVQAFVPCYGRRPPQRRTQCRQRWSYPIGINWYHMVMPRTSNTNTSINQNIV